MKLIKSKEIVNIDKVERILIENENIKKIVICNQVYLLSENDIISIKRLIYELSDHINFNSVYLIFEHNSDKNELNITHKPFIGSA